MLNVNTPCPSEYVHYRTSFNGDVGSHGGSLICVRRDIPHSHYLLNTSLQAVAVQFNIRRKYTVCSLYLPPNDPFPREEILNLMRQLPEPFLILGDVNGRHPMWGDAVPNLRGNILSSIIENEDVNILNSGEPTHFHLQTGSLSCIDLSLCSSNCTLDFSWRVLDDLHSSDHFPIVLDTTDCPPSSRAPKWCIDKADWQKFKLQSEVAETVADLPTVDSCIDILISKLISAGFEFIPRTTGIFKHRPVPWWSDTIRQLHRATRRSLTRLRRHRNEENLVAYKRNRAILRRAIKEAKRQSWSNFVSSINSKTPLSIIWKKIRKISGKFVPSPPPALDVDGHIITDPETVNNCFAENFARISRKSVESPGHELRVRDEMKNLDFRTNGYEPYNLPFTEREYDSALASCNDTAPGPDGIPYIMLKHVSPSTKNFIIQLFTRIWFENAFPSSWELAYILPFSKPGKDSSKVTNYRPIALTSCLCKLMEKMVNARLVWFLERKGIFSPSQCGFRKMHSTYDALIRLEASICEAFASNHHHLTVFFDLEKAYDTTWRYGILRKLHSCGLRGELPMFIRAFLRLRYK